jgi:hypothetical protein
MNRFLSFCFDIGRIPTSVLLTAAEGLVRSLNYHNNHYEFIFYTNMPQMQQLELAKQSNVRIIPYRLEDIPGEYGNNSWHNLSTFKLKAISQNVNEKGEPPMWIDLDTIVCRNIDHLVNYPNFFIMQGTEDERLFEIFPGVSVVNKNYIQGNIWKLSPELFCIFTEMWAGFERKPNYDLQGMFNYGYHFKELKEKMLILGRDIDADTVNGLDVVHPVLLRHPSIGELRGRLRMDDHDRLIQVPTDRKLQFFSFTFFTLSEFVRGNLFAQLEDKRAVAFFKACGY